MNTQHIHILYFSVLAVVDVEHLCFVIAVFARIMATAAWRTLVACMLIWRAGRFCFGKVARAHVFMHETVVGGGGGSTALSKCVP